jgi:trimeric autotransporter adhesin
LFVTNQNVAANTTAITSLQVSDTAQTSAIAANTSAIGALDARVDGLETLALDFDSRLDRVDDRASAGTAVAIALGGATFLPGKQFSLSGSVGTYRGAHAAALQVGAMIGENAAINAGVATGFNKGGKIGARAGFTVGF